MLNTPFDRLSDEERAEQVAYVASIFDDNYPGWAERVDVADLDLQDSRKCVGHYADGEDWLKALRTVKVSTSMEYASSVAKRIDVNDSAGHMLSNNAWRPFWVTEIAKRLLSTPAPTPETPKVVVYVGDDADDEAKAALYVDGMLDTVGYREDVYEEALHVCGVDFRESDSYLLGGDSALTVAANLDAIEEYERKPEPEMIPWAEAVGRFEAETGSEIWAVGADNKGPFYRLQDDVDGGRKYAPHQVGDDGMIAVLP